MFFELLPCIDLGYMHDDIGDYIINMRKSSLKQSEANDWTIFQMVFDRLLLEFWNLLIPKIIA